MPPRKRAAPSGPSTSSTTGPKRTRLANDDDVGGTAAGDLAAAGDDDLELSAPKRGAVRVDGYDSDSSVGSDDAFPRRPAAAADDDDDMFNTTGPEMGDKNKDELTGERRGADRGMAVKSGARQKEFLDVDDIEGQENDDGGVENWNDSLGKGKKAVRAGDREDEEDVDGDEEDYDLEDDRANDDDAPRSRRSKKGFGFQLSKFNMKEELSEGRMSTDGSYVRNAEDPYVVHDSWLDDVSSKKAIRAAAEAKRRQDEREKTLQRREEATLPREDAYKAILDEGLVRQGENITSALKRLGDRKKLVEKEDGRPQRARAVPSSSSTAKDGETGMEVDAAAPTHDDASATPAISARLQSITDKLERLTSLSSILLSTYNELGVYQASYDDILQILRTEGVVRRAWEPNPEPDEDDAPGTTGPTSKAARNGSTKIAISRPTGGDGASSASNAGGLYYKWRPRPPGQPGPDASQVHGPFSEADFRGWASQGYFGADGSSVEVRVGESGEWTCWANVQSRSA